MEFWAKFVISPEQGFLGQICHFSWTGIFGEISFFVTFILKVDMEEFKILLNFVPLLLPSIRSNSVELLAVLKRNSAPKTSVFAKRIYNKIEAVHKVKIRQNVQFFKTFIQNNFFCKIIFSVKNSHHEKIYP